MIASRFTTARAHRVMCGAAYVLCLALLAALASPAALAGVILSVSGPANTGETLTANQAAAAAFTLTGALTDVTITATTNCVDCSGGIWLNETQVGPGTPFADTLVGDSYPGTSSISLSSLAAGTYFLIFSTDDSTTGSLAWEGSNPTTVTSSDGASAAGDLLATSCTDPLAPLCNFSTVFGVGLNFTVSGTPVTSSVPEPSPLALLAGAMVGLGIAVRRRRGRGGIPL